jgi:iron(III) transport system substrate-binding protein
MRTRSFLTVVIALVFSICCLQTSVHAADPAVIEAAKKEGKFVWYTSMPTAGAVAFLDAFKKKYPFLDTGEFFRSTSYKTYTRINIEKGAGKHLVDCAHVAILAAYREWKQKGWLVKYDSPAYDGYPEKIMDRGYWAPMRTFAIVMAYNKTILPEKEVPEAWADLTDPKWKGLIGVEGSDSGAQHIQYYVLNQVMGDGFWKKIAANQPKIFSGSGAMMTGLLRGEIKVAMYSMGFAVYRQREIEGAPIEGIWPKEGCPINIAPLGIMSDAPHPHAARLFMDWALSQEGQAEMVKLVGAYSGRADVSSAKGNPAWGTFTPLYVDDWDKFNASKDEFKSVWDSIKQ